MCTPRRAANLFSEDSNIETQGGRTGGRGGPEGADQQTNTTDNFVTVRRDSRGHPSSFKSMSHAVIASGRADLDSRWDEVIQAASPQGGADKREVLSEV